ncbi:maternal effect embryo arrest [Thalictrum thalictroides]|uniref:Maternal effect embryo arrest n=1 Tax=Thalictrum thalictroides TaxID=46969 RepID=A0A7J6WTQ0_THATH|nr:maternal effect embryo arrest [Thalictrum thalictroides]
MSRPNRSDVHVSLEEERKIEEKTREQFDAIAPKRHTKPQRSDYSSDSSDAHRNFDRDVNIPELIKFQHLENDDPQKLNYNRSDATEEYVETDYYDDLNGVDKQHHTTGTGFIGMETTNSNCFKLEADSTGESHASCKGNPATNDWIPSAPDTTISSSNKPNRSENK